MKLTKNQDPCFISYSKKLHYIYAQIVALIIDTEEEKINVLCLN